MRSTSQRTPDDPAPHHPAREGIELVRGRDRFPDVVVGVFIGLQVQQWADAQRQVNPDTFLANPGREGT
jgi:hypothetical protein